MNLKNIQITTFNIATRYNDYKRNFYKMCDYKFAKEWLSIGKEMLIWLKSQQK